MGDVSEDPAFDSRLLRVLLESFVSLQRLAVDAEGTIVAANEQLAGQLGVALDRLRGRAVGDFLAAADARLVADWAAGGSLPDAPTLLNFVDSSQRLFTLRCAVARHGDRLELVGESTDAGPVQLADELMRVNNDFATMTRELARRGRELERTHGQLAVKLEELESSYWHLRKIQEVMPICMGCGQVKSDGSRWESVVDYLKSNNIFLSHGYCPPCAGRVARDYGLDSA